MVVVSLPCAILVWLEALRDRASAPIQNIQVRPKDLRAALRQVERAVDWPAVSARRLENPRCSA
jgi:hypothetical protein